MLIGDTYKIESDTLNVTLFHRAIGNKSWQVVGYFSTVKDALEHLVDLEVNTTELKDLQTVCDKIDEVKGMIKEMV